MCTCWLLSFFFFNDTATTEIYTLSLHDALPIYAGRDAEALGSQISIDLRGFGGIEDRKSTRLNSSHLYISYAVFCLKKKTKKSKQNNDKYVRTTQPHVMCDTQC